MSDPQAVTIQLQMPNQSGLFEHIKENRQYAKKMATTEWGKGKTVVICGAGPSLTKYHDEIRATKAHMVWAANSALPYMMDHGLPVTHGVSVDQSEEMYTVDWKRTFPVKYILGSCVDPNLTRHLLKDHRDIRWFHSYLGIPNPEGWVPPPGWQPPAMQPNAGYEMWLYQHTWPPSVQVGYGLNTVPRAICLALWCQFKKIIVYGADCACLPDATPMVPMGTPEYPAWLDSLMLYADGRTPRIYGDNAVITEGMIDGRRWHTRPDMLISAVMMHEMRETFPAIELRGDTLPNAFKGKPREFFETQLPRLTGNGGVEGFGLLTPQDIDSQRSA